MDYLLLQILLFLILAAVIGFFIGWISRGHGFESRILTSENQWRSRHHVLQEEINRLKSELKAIDQNTAHENAGTPPQQTIQNDVALSLPFKSSRDKEPARLSTHNPDTGTVEDHPLEKLRSELNQIEKAHTDEYVVEEPVPVQTEIFEEEAEEESGAPISLDQPDGEADNLKLIKGIGPKIESTLNGLGIYHFNQIADFTEENVSWVDEHLRFSGRIEREDWITQAKDLASKT